MDNKLITKNKDGYVDLTDYNFTKKDKKGVWKEEVTVTETHYCAKCKYCPKVSRSKNYNMTLYNLSVHVNTQHRKKMLQEIEAMKE